MRVLVTGSTGFIGSHLCRALAQRGDQVLGFHREHSDVSQLKGIPVEHVIGDVTLQDDVRRAMKGVDVIFHTAAQVTRPKKFKHWVSVNVAGTAHVMQTALEYGVKRVVYTSSAVALGVPDRLGSSDLMNEKHTWNYQAQRWPYACAKYLAELEVQKAVARGLDAVTVNPCKVVGAGDINRRDSIIMQVACRKVPVLVDGGLNVVHIEDVVAGHLAALEQGRRGERYILGGENMTIPDFIRKIASVAGVKPPTLVIPNGVAHTLAALLHRLKIKLFSVEVQQLYLAGYYFYYDLQKSKKELGMNICHPAAIAIRDAYDWFMQPA